MGAVLMALWAGGRGAQAAIRLRRHALPALLAFLGLLWGLWIARAPLPWAIAPVAGAALVVGTFIEPLFGLVVALFLGPLRAWLEIWRPGLVSNAGQAVLVLALAAWIAGGLWRRELRFPRPPLTVPLLGFLFVALLSLWTPFDVWASFLEFAKWVQILLVIVMVYDRLTQPNASRRVALLVAGLAGSAVVQAAIGLWQFGLRAEGVENFAIDDHLYRAYGTFQQPNPFGAFMGLMGAFLIGLALATIVDRWQRRRPIPFWVWGVSGAASLAVAGLVASWSRGGWMGFGAAVLMMTVFLPRRGLWGAVLVAALLIGGAWLYTTGRLPSAIASRLTSFLAYTQFDDVRGVGVTDANYAVIERMAHWQAALSMWRANFWLGVGLGGYGSAYPDYDLINWPLPLGHAHNYYLNLAAETGLLGLIAFLVWFGALYVRLIVMSRRLTGWQRGLALGMIGTWTHFAVHSLVDTLLVNNIHLHLAVLLGLAAYVVRTVVRRA
ncbi:MAG: O-antigen ligase family protein [Anaerolineae bacterium]